MSARRLPLTVLVSEGPIARAYLAGLAGAGFRPDRIVLMVGSRHPIRKRPFGRWLPRSMRIAYAERVQEAAFGHWPRHLVRTEGPLVSSMCSALAALHPDPRAIVEAITAPAGYERYGAPVDRVFVDGLRDPALAKHLAALAPQVVLFTGGGIVPAGLLGIPGLRFLHVHPGRLPYVRGADGVLWSMLVRGQPGASCFYMATGIDTGDVIATRDLPAVVCPVPEASRPDDQTLYRALFSFYDPMVRTRLLLDVLEGARADLAELPATAQRQDEGVTYHFMHSAMRAAALGTVFPARAAV